MEPKHISKTTLFPAYRYFNIISFQLAINLETRVMVLPLGDCSKMAKEEVVMPAIITAVFNAAVPLTEHDLVIETPQDTYFMKEKHDGTPYVGIWNEKGVMLYEVQGSTMYTWTMDIPTNEGYEVYVQYEMVDHFLQLVTVLEVRYKKNLIATSEFERFAALPRGTFQ